MDEILQQALKQFGTPQYLFDLDRMKKTVDELRECIDGKAELCFAMKANPFIALNMSEWVDRIEVCSMGEYEICAALKLPPEKLLISGVLKKKEDIRKILDTCGGVCHYTAESPYQYQLISEWAGEHQVKVQVYLRLSSKNQFGMDEETMLSLIEKYKDDSFVDITGIHYFSGTQKKSTEKMKKELAYLDDWLEKLTLQYNLPISVLEYGPGLRVSYFEGQEDTYREDCRELAGIIDGMRWKKQVVLEMGRALSAYGGYYMTSILDLKQTDGRKYAIVDGGLHQMNYDGQIKGMYRPYMHKLKDNGGEKEELAVCGSLCTVNDCLVQKAQLEAPVIGDVLVFERLGAYSMTEGMSLFLSHELPAITFYSEKGGLVNVREQKETYHFNSERR